jgi:mono/diheme cytochrome c family protein
MRKILKWIGLISGAMIVTAAIFIAVLILLANARLNKIYAVPVEAILISSNSAAVERGNQIGSSVCVSCHGQNLAGEPVFNISSFAASSAGANNQAQDEDWMGEMQHGVENEQYYLFSMPSPEFYILSDADLPSVIAHNKSETPVQNTMQDPSLPAMVKLLWVMDAVADLD